MAGLLKQGSVRALTLFTVFFFTMLRRETSQGPGRRTFAFAPTGACSTQLKADSKTMEQVIKEILFADDAALLVHIESTLQRITSCFVEVAQFFGLEVSLRKKNSSTNLHPEKITTHCHQHRPDRVENSPSVSANWGA